jgi:hypothetical protein
MIGTLWRSEAHQAHEAKASREGDQMTSKRR